MPLSPRPGPRSSWRPAGALAMELRGLAEVPRLLVAWPGLRRLPRGGGAPVMVIPGFGTSDRATVVLRHFLSRQGYQAVGWGLGRNEGDVRAVFPQLLARLGRLSAERPVRLVGWSLGGVIARALAHEVPTHVDRVVTLGTPVVGGAKYTRVAHHYRARGIDLDEMERRIDKGLQPMPVPITAIYSKRDGVVAWHACVDPVTPHARHVEVRATHLGMGISPDVLRQLAHSLAGASS
jgi:pimeloyl-ACP methyl ester carboxylesterase